MIEIKFVLGVQLSLVVPSPACSLETLGRPQWTGVSSEEWGKLSRARFSVGFLEPQQIQHHPSQSARHSRYSFLFYWSWRKLTGGCSSGDDLGWAGGCLQLKRGRQIPQKPQS